MAKRSNDREGNGLARKLIIWIVIVLVIVWATRDPHQAASVVHAVATEIANLTQVGSHH